MFRSLRMSQLVVDIVVACAFLLLCTAMTFGGSFSYGLASVGGLWHIAVLLGMSGALAIRRVAPGLALGIAWATALVQMASGVSPNPVDLATFVVVYTAAAYGSSRSRWLALASSLVAPLAITAYVVVAEGFGELGMCLQFEYSYCVGYVPNLAGRAAGWFVAFAFAYLLAWTIGQVVRTRIRAGETRQAMLAAEREVAAEQERTRIARDMHDVVAHSLAVVVAQADGARYATRANPAAAEDALRTIAATAREALGDVRVLLAQLRYQQEDGPQPSIGDLEHLLEQLRASGLQVLREDAGAPLALGTAQQIAVYRIVQESLTNALRHADVTHVVLVRFAWTSHGLELAVVSRMPEVRARTGVIPTTASASGHGIAGMRERASLGGGWLRAGVDGDRFVVTAWLPYQPTGAHAPLDPVRVEETPR